MEISKLLRRWRLRWLLLLLLLLLLQLWLRLRLRLRLRLQSMIVLVGSRIRVPLDVIRVTGRGMRWQNALNVLVCWVGQSVVRNEVHGSVTLAISRDSGINGRRHYVTPIIGRSRYDRFPASSFHRGAAGWTISTDTNGSDVVHISLFGSGRDTSSSSRIRNVQLLLEILLPVPWILIKTKSAVARRRSRMLPREQLVRIRFAIQRVLSGNVGILNDSLIDVVDLLLHRIYSVDRVRVLLVGDQRADVRVRRRTVHRLVVQRDSAINVDAGVLVIRR